MSRIVLLVVLSYWILRNVPCFPFTLLAPGGPDFWRDAKTHHGVEKRRTVVAWGYNNHGQTEVPFGVIGVMAIAAGFRVESTASFTPAILWNTEPGSFQPNGGFISLPGLPMTGPQKFYGWPSRNRRRSLPAVWN